MSQPKTAEEVAKNIYAQGKLSWTKWTVKWIQDQITAFSAEHCKHDTCKDCGCTYENCCCNPIREMEARNAGLEEAAKIVSEWWKIDRMKYGVNPNPEFMDEVAERIRARKDKNK